MKSMIMAAALACTTAFCGAASADVLRFDLGGLADITGGFSFDTLTQTLGNVGFTTLNASYATGGATFATANSFGPNALFSFTEPGFEFVLDLGTLNPTANTIAPGSSLTASLFGIEGIAFSPFTPIPLSLYAGPVTVANVTEVAAVPLPAALSLLMVALGGLGLARRRKA